MSLIAVVTTTGSREEARQIARALVTEGVAACVQISEIESFYTWEGTLQQDSEFRVVAKTTEELYPKVEAAIKRLHSYDLPAIYSLPLTQVYSPYAEWVAEEVRSGGVEA